MRALLFVSISLAFSSVYSQSKDKDHLQVKQSIENILTLNKVESISRRMEAYSLQWLFMVIGANEKYQLAEITNIEIPALLLDQNIQPIYNPLLQQMDSIRQQVSSQTQKLLTFEDYYDSSGYLSPKAIQVQAYYDSIIAPAYSRLYARINSDRDAERKTLHALFSNDPMQSFEYIERNFHMLQEIQDVSLYCFSWYTGTVNWVYRRYDSLSCSSFQDQLEKSFTLTSDDMDLEERLMLMEFEELIDNQNRMSRAVIENLSSEADYEDPITLLLAEDAIDSDLFPRLREIILQTQEIEIQRKEALDNVIADDYDKKLADIKKMLKYNSPMLQFAIKDLESRNPGFKLDELLDEICLIYAQRFTHAEIREVLAYQKSRVGKKMRKHSDEILLETIRITQEYMQKSNSKPKKIKLNGSE